MRILFLLAITTVWCFGSQANVYLASAAAGANDGSSCGNAHIYTFFNSAGNWGAGATQIGTTTNDTIVHLCGTITASSNSTALTFQASGTSGHPITLLWETGAILQAPYFAASSGGGACGGGICAHGLTDFVIDGGSNGIIQNTANGTGLANQQSSLMIDEVQCNRCTVKNLHFNNIYVRTSPSDTAIDETQMACIQFDGASNALIQGNHFDQVGWCVKDAFDTVGGANLEISQNYWVHFAHGIMIAANAAATVTGTVKIHDNEFDGPGTTWDGSGCPFHQDGIHLFGTGTTTVMDSLYMYNNYFHGDWGQCPTGFVFEESGTSPVDIKDGNYWNNVGVLNSSGQVENTNGWFNLYGKVGFTMRFVNNTMIGTGVADNTNCIVLNGNGTLILENNTISKCGDPIYIQSLPTAATIDYNLYGTTTCTNGGNCFITPGPVFQSSFANFKTWCTGAAFTGCEAHGVSNTSPLLNADGSPQASSPAISAATNLSSTASGNLASLQNDTTKGNTRTALARPGGATAWDIGAYQFAAASGGVPSISFGGKITVH